VRATEARRLRREGASMSDFRHDPRTSPTMKSRRTMNGNRYQERPMLQAEHLVEKVDNDDSGKPLKRAAYDEEVHPCRTSCTLNGNLSQERPMLQAEHLVEKVDNE
jgi:hypothetical protein